MIVMIIMVVLTIYFMATRSLEVTVNSFETLENRELKLNYISLNGLELIQECRYCEALFMKELDEKYNQIHQHAFDELGQNVGQMMNLAKAINNQEIISSIEDSKNLAGGYYENYNRAISLLVQKGLTQNDGLRLALRSAVHKVEELLKSVNNTGVTLKMLTIRCSEKDYIIRGESKYVEQTIKNIENLVTAIKNSNLSQYNQQTIIERLGLYYKAFVELINIDKELN